jgi:hypothetical protein
LEKGAESVPLLDGEVGAKLPAHSKKRCAQAVALLAVDRFHLPARRF